MEQEEAVWHSGQVLRCLYQHDINHVDAMGKFANHLHTPEKNRTASLSLVSCHLAPDNVRKFIFNVGRGNQVETVFIPSPSRGSICLSTQAGCTLACAFCATGQQGFSHNLTVAQIIGQIWQVRQMLSSSIDNGELPPIRNVVFMGMGEPLSNFSNVVHALHLLLDDNAWGFSRRRVTISTVGIVPAMDRLREVAPVALAVSLHAPDDELRNRLVPLNRKYPLRELLNACLRYLERAPRGYITFEYTLISGVNDSDAQARALTKLLRQVPCKLNLIPLNTVSALPWQRPSDERVFAFQKILLDAGYFTTVRKARGSEIGAACGQLVGKIQDKTRRARFNVRKGKKLCT